MLKKIMYFSIFAVFLASCSNDFDLIDNKREIPVIYGILSKQDSAHYIRIERAFADENKSAPELAKNVDSLYYKDITVQLIRAKDNKTYTLQQVDGNKEGYKRQSGIFADAPNYLYKIKASEIKLETNEIYKLLVKRKDGTILTEAQTVIVPDMVLEERITAPGKPPLINAGSIKVAWVGLDPLAADPKYSDKQVIGNAKMFDVSMIVEITEAPKDGSTPQRIELVWDITRSFVPNPNNGELTLAANSVTYRSQEPNAFYRFIDRSLTNSKPALRRVEGIKYKIASGGNDLYQYINVGNINTGITGTEVLPTYSNIKNGYGVLSSKNYFISDSYALGKSSLDSLINGSITKKYGFAN